MVSTSQGYISPKILESPSLEAITSAPTKKDVIFQSHEDYFVHFLEDKKKVLNNPR
jgi:hypothetical protein